MEVVERILPTYRQHAARRADEMVELEATMRGLGLEPCVAGGVRRFLDALVRSGLEADGASRNGSTGTMSNPFHHLPGRRLQERVSGPEPRA
jgi:hypothetical protein